jgi:DNA-binding response OmpR family regulator
MTIRILVADDDGDLRRLYSFIFDREGYEVIEASDGEQALARALDSAPALIVLDVMMPEPDGMEVCRRLKNDYRTCAVPILLVTAHAGPGSRMQGLLAGAFELLGKPFSPYRLIAQVRAALHQPEPSTGSA